MSDKNHNVKGMDSYAVLRRVIHCLLLGHNDEGDTDSGYKVCARCNKHEYYDYDTYYKSAYLYAPRWYFYRLIDSCGDLLKKLRPRRAIDDTELPFYAP